MFFCTIYDVKHDSGECMSPCKRICVCVRNGENKKKGLILRDKTLTYYSAATTSETSVHGGRRVLSGLP